MLKREIKYKNFDEEDVTEVFYFNLSKSELIELEVEYKEGFGAMLQKLVNEEDRNEMIKMFKRFILMAYGEKSEDGKRFIKSDQLHEEFSQTAAFDALFIEMGSNLDAAVDFLKGILPKDLVAEINKNEELEAAKQKAIDAQKSADVTTPTNA